MKSSNLTHVILIATTSVLTGGLNYLYYPLVLRYMSMGDFGVFSALISVINILSIFTIGLSLYLTRTYSQRRADEWYTRTLTLRAWRELSMVGLGIWAIYLLMTPILARYMQIEDRYIVASMGISVLIACIWAVSMAYMRSYRLFSSISWLQIAGPLVKLALWAGLIGMGYGLYGALGGVVLSWVIIALLWVYMIRRTWRSGSIDRSVDFWWWVRGSWREVGAYVMSSIFFTLLMNIDVILAKNLYTPEMAGLYAGVAVVGKFLIFLLMSLETVYYGQIMEHSVATVPRKLVIEPILYIVGATVVSYIGAYLVGGYALGMLKSDLAGETDLLLLFVVFSWLLSLTSHMSKVLIGWDTRGVSAILAVWLASLVSLIYILEPSGLMYYLSIITVVIGAITVVLAGVFVRRMARIQ